MQTTTTIAMLGAAIIHLLPAVGVLGGDRLAQLYGVHITDPNLLLLMRHRAILFGLLGLVLLFAAFIPEHRSLAIAVGLVSTASFVMLAIPPDSFNREILKVAVIDIIAIVLLLLAAFTHWRLI